jgi:hypothetical protein
MVVSQHERRDAGRGGSRRIAAGLCGLVGGGLRLRAGVQPATLAQPGNLRLSEIPEFAAPLRVDRPRGRELAQSLTTDLQLVCGDGQGNQAVLRHARDSSAYANSLPRRCLRVHQITGKILCVTPSNQGGVLKEIPLTQGMVAIVDDEDYERVSRHRWYALAVPTTGNVYAATGVGSGVGDNRKMYMHTLIMGEDAEGRTVDHRTGEGLDNRRSNLRWATSSQQKMNARKRSDNTTGFKGVFLDPKRQRYYVQVQLNGKRHCVGRFDTAEQAARAYDSKARELFGDFARTNFDGN